MLADGEGVRLSSVIYPTIWPVGGELVAHCRRRRQLPRELAAQGAHAAPEARCQCGIYGVNHPTLLRPYLERQPAEGEARGRLLARVPGRVWLWGTVVEASRGWRASRAYPQHLYVSASTHAAQLVEGDELAWALSIYGVPVELIAGRTMAELAEALPQARQA